MKKGNSSVRNTAIIISIISVISFPLTSDSLTRNAPFYLRHWIYCKPLFYRTVFIETKISSDAPKNVKYLYKTFEKIIVDLNFYTEGVFLSCLEIFLSLSMWMFLLFLRSEGPQVLRKIHKKKCLNWIFGHNFCQNQIDCDQSFQNIFWAYWYGFKKI